MKIALVHELLTMRGGAERVLKILGEMYPEAPIYTLLYNEKKLGDWFPRERVHTSKLQKFAGISTNHHLYLPFFPRAVEAWDFSEYDIVLSTSSAFVHGIITNSAPKHLCYVNSPARYLWDRYHDVLSSANPLARLYFSHIAHKLRIWDSEAADRPDTLLAASKEVQRRVEKYWRRESTVVYPPVDDFWFENGVTLSSSKRDERAILRRAQDDTSYFLIVSTLVPYKRIELAIQACNSCNVPLKIVGEGPDLSRLESLAGEKTEFLGFRSQEEIKELYTNAQATIFPGQEDFGLVPLESMACGTPVIAYRGGGALETIVEGETGEFFDEAISTSLAQILKKFDSTRYAKETCHSQAEIFSRKSFEEEIHKELLALAG